MNCAKHTDLPAVAYCRICGKAICADCKREVQGAIYCEECLQARSPQPAARPVAPPPPPADANPGLAAFLGFIPGVGAMYNGQFAKAFLHVIVFACLIWLSDHAAGAFGVVVFAWYCYMIFDAYTTAKARKYGLPLPDPLGINRMLGQQEPAAGATAPQPGTASPGTPNPQAGTQAGFVPPQGTYIYSASRPKRDRAPIGALILIALGGLFLLSNLGLLNVNWGRYWPVILIVIGIGIILRRFGNGKPPVPPANDAPAPPEEKAE